MTTFSEFMANQQPVPGVSASQISQPKWKANKEQILQYWQSLRPNLPIQIRPLEHGHKGTTYAQDGLRITGSKEFIGSVLSRLKDLTQYDNPASKLQLVYREVERKPEATGTALAPLSSFVFYLQAQERGPRRQKKPKLGRI